MKVYFDNMLVSAMVRGDLADPVEMAAVSTLQAYPSNVVEIVTSRESWREQERTADVGVREQLRAAQARVKVVEDDHRFLGMNNIDLGGEHPRWPRGFVASPLVTDITDPSVFAALTAAGLKKSDAQHLMYTLCNGCVRFVTTDPDFVNRQGKLQAKYPAIRIVKPSELLNEITSVQSKAPSS